MTMETLRSRFAALSRRDMCVGGAGLCICAVLFYLARTPETPAVIETPAPVRAAQPDEPQEIIGLAAAARRPELRDPFTYAHETRGETVRSDNAAQSPNEKKQEERTRPAHMAATAPPAASGAMGAASPGVPPGKQESPVLRGTVTGADGSRIAILAIGEESAALAAGDTWRDYAVADVGDAAVTLRRGDDTVTLRRE